MKDCKGNDLEWGDWVVVVKGKYRGFVGSFEEDRYGDTTLDDGESDDGICIVNPASSSEDEVCVPPSHVQRIPSLDERAKEILEEKSET